MSTFMNSSKAMRSATGTGGTPVGAGSSAAAPHPPSTALGRGGGSTLLGGKLRRGGEVDRDLGHGVQVVADDLVADGHNDVDEIALRPSAFKEGDGRSLGDVAALLRHLAHEPRQRVELGIEARAAAADFEDLSVREADHLSDRGMGGQAIFAVVDLADDEIDDFPLLAVERGLRRPGAPDRSAAPSPNRRRWRRGSGRRTPASSACRTPPGSRARLGRGSGRSRGSWLGSWFCAWARRAQEQPSAFPVGI